MQTCFVIRHVGRWYSRSAGTRSDVSDYLLVALSKLGVIRDVRRALAHVVAAIAQPTAGQP